MGIINLIKMIELLYLGIGLILGLFLAYFMNAAKPTKSVEADKEADWEDEVSLDSEDEQMTSDISFLTAKEYTDVMNTKFPPKDSEIKMVLVVRTDLGMTKGKMGA